MTDEPMTAQRLEAMKADIASLQGWYAKPECSEARLARALPALVAAYERALKDVEAIRHMAEVHRCTEFPYQLNDAEACKWIGERASDILPPPLASYGSGRGRPHD
jgi:hypothetical protein